jgi:hypothetical protein
MNGPITSIVFTVQVTACPQNVGDGSNQHYVAQAQAPNGTSLSYRGEGPTVSAALRQLVHAIELQEHASTLCR